MVFCAIQENRILPIYQQISSRRDKVVAENRLKLRSITATVIFCGQQGLAFRGHRDYGPVSLDDSTFNRDNSVFFRGIVIYFPLKMNPERSSRV